MGLINMYENKYEWNSETGEYRTRLICNGLSISNTFLDIFRFKKANKSFRCNICGKEKPKNTRYLGGNYDRVCCDCSPEWFENSKKALQEMEMLLEKSKKDLKLNKDKWRKEMILGSLS